VLRRGVTWDVLAPAPPTTKTWRRDLSVISIALTLAATTAVAGVTVLRPGAAVAPVQVGSNPWFASLWSTPTSTTPLPDLASIERVVKAQGAWAAGGDGKGVDVAVLDSGVTPVPGLDGPNKLVIGPDLSFDSQNPKLAGLDAFGHGTAMASIIAGNDGVPGGFKGVAPEARIVSVKVGSANGAVDVSQVIAGIDWVVEHAHDPGLNIRVLNISLGTNSLQRYQLDPLAHAAEVAWRAGIVVVAAVGNKGNNNSTVADPAIDPYVLAVGASDSRGTINDDDDTVASFSSKGNSTRHADVVAPGAYIVGLRVPNSFLDQQFPGARVGDRFFRGSGTSQAAAIVSGAVADLLSYRPRLTADSAKQALMRSSESISGSSVRTGEGQINIKEALTERGGGDATQSFPLSTGGGSLESSRGDSHVVMGGVTLTGETDIFGNPWNSAQIAAAEEAGTTWSGGTYNGATWSGATWSGATWSGATWSADGWAGATWSGATWSGATWSGATWSGATWSGATWSGATWSGATWSGATWSGATWSGATWSGATWSGADWA
jgi:serine protease AprX